MPEVMLIRVRRRLIDAVRALAEQGTTPPGVDKPEVYRVRSGGVFLPKHANRWPIPRTSAKPLLTTELDPALTGDR